LRIEDGQTSARPTPSRMGSLHPPDPHRPRRPPSPSGPGRGSVDVAIRDEATGSQARASPTGASRRPGRDLKPAMVIKGQDGRAEARAWRRCPLLVAVAAILAVDSAARSKPAHVIARNPAPKRQDPRNHRRSAAGGGVFEARKPKGRWRSSPKYPAQRSSEGLQEQATARIVRREGRRARGVVILRARTSSGPQDGEHEKGDTSAKEPGAARFLAIKGVEELANYLSTRSRRVYRFRRADQRQAHRGDRSPMLQKLELDEFAKTTCSTQSRWTKLEVDEINCQVRAEGKKPRRAHDLLGITSEPEDLARSLGGVVPGEPARLPRSAVNGKAERSEGLKENVIVGRMIPAGTAPCETG